MTWTEQARTFLYALWEILKGTISWILNTPIVIAIIVLTPITYWVIGQNKK